MHRDFEKFAISRGISSLKLHNFKTKAMTPYIIEERELNVAQMDVFSRLMMDKTIFLGTDIDDIIANVIQAQLLYLESNSNSRDTITLMINSPGGYIHAGLGIYDTMNFINNDVATMCTGMAASMAAVLLSAGANGKRSSLPHSRIMIHQPSGGTIGRTSDMEIDLKLIQDMRTDLYKILADTTGKTTEEIKQDCLADYWLTSREALEYGTLGLIDNIYTKRK